MARALGALWPITVLPSAGSGVQRCNNSLADYNHRAWLLLVVVVWRAHAPLTMHAHYQRLLAPGSESTPPTKGKAGTRTLRKEGGASCSGASGGGGNGNG